MSTIHFEPLECRVSEAGDRPTFPLPASAERAAGLLLLAAASPVIAASALIITVKSRRWPLIAHLRISQEGRPFWMLKLRTMWPAGDEGRPAAGWIERIIADPPEDGKDPHDPRLLSRFAAFCRRHSIDELPQLWHVARGEMSLVGPRPLTRGEIERYYGVHARELLSVKPGMTGLWQVCGRSDIRFPQRAAMDLHLIQTLTFRTYLKILLRTVPAIIRGDGAW